MHIFYTGALSTLLYSITLYSINAVRVSVRACVSAGGCSARVVLYAANERAGEKRKSVDELQIGFRGAGQTSFISPSLYLSLVASLALKWALTAKVCEKPNRIYI